MKNQKVNNFNGQLNPSREIAFLGRGNVNGPEYSSVKWAGKETYFHPSPPQIALKSNSQITLNSNENFDKTKSLLTPVNILPRPRKVSQGHINS